MAWVPSWLGRRPDQIVRMTRALHHEAGAAPQPFVMCITIIQLARPHSGWPTKSALGTRYQTVFNAGLRLPLKTPYRIDDGDSQQTTGRQR